MYFKGSVMIEDDIVGGNMHQQIKISDFSG